jgi:hypothetical protein
MIQHPKPPKNVEKEPTENATRCEKRGVIIRAAGVVGRSCTFSFLFQSLCRYLLTGTD